MYSLTAKETPRTYKNNGIHAQQVACYTLTNELKGHDNLRYDKGADILDYQVKSAKASLHDPNLEKASKFIYVSKDFKTLYIMNRAEYQDFINNFSYKSKESQKNGGGEKLRLLDESKRMLQWLNERV